MKAEILHWSGGFSEYKIFLLGREYRIDSSEMHVELFLRGIWRWIRIDHPRAQSSDTINTMSLMELGRRIHANEITFEDALREIKEGSCSVLLNWSEDDGELWECSWIVGGERYTGYHPQPRTALLAAVVECTKHLVATVAHTPEQ